MVQFGLGPSLFYFVRRKEKGYLDFESEFSLAFSSVWPMEDGVYVC